MTGDSELDRLQERFPTGLQVRVGPSLVDQGMHIVLGHERMAPPFQRPVLVLKTPDGETVRADPDMWRIDAS